MGNDLIKGARVHHIALRVRDMDEALKFYCEGLGMKRGPAWQNGAGRAAMVEIGDGGILEMFDQSETGLDDGYDLQSGQFFHLAIEVDDVDFAFNRALECGALEKQAPFDVSLPAEPPMPVRVAFVFGPSGECLEFFHVY